MKQNYTEKQTGLFMNILLSAVLLFMLITEILLKSNPGYYMYIPIGIILIALLFFFRMDTIVNQEAVEIRFLFGLYTKRIPLQNIYNCTVVTPKWYHGIGIHIVASNATLYNVKYGKAVQITLRTGGKIWIGTGNPEALIKSIHDMQA